MSTTAISSYSPRHIDFTEMIPFSKELSLLIPTVSALALGIIYASNVPVGIAIGLGTFAIGTIVSRVFEALNLVEEDPNNTYETLLEKNPLFSTLVAPLVEEGFFRGVVQPWATRVIIFLVPTATAAFCGTGLSVAATVAIVATASLFGLVHAFNDHKNSHLQAVIAVIGGVILGATAAQFGLAAAIAAHTVNNTLAMMDLFSRSTAEAMSESVASRV